VSAVTHTTSGTKRQQRRRGAAAVDYLFCLSLIIIVCIAAVRFVGGMLDASVSHSADQIKKAGSK
jgi:hypothetical protein